MTRTALILVIVIALAVTGCQRGGQESGERNGSRSATDSRSAEIAKDEGKDKDGEADGNPILSSANVRLGKTQAVTLPRREPTTEEEGKAVKSLIASLAKLDRPDFGLSSTLTGNSFSPIKGLSQASMLLLTDHKIQPSVALQKLVEIGPRALPFLLDALGDSTPTKLTIEHEGVFGAMWLDNELWGNPVNPAERRVLSKRKRPDDRGPETHIKSYTVKVGDVCFVAIGQIVGRPYSCVRYQPTACVVINSPTEDAELRAEVRAIWASKDPVQKHLNTLLIDYATEGIYLGESMTGFYIGSNLQAAAATRLLCYYPAESVPFLAARLRSLDVRDTGGDLERWAKREASNGVRTSDFIKAVRWSQEPKIQEALREIANRTNDKEIAESLNPKPFGGGSFFPGESKKP